MYSLLIVILCLSFIIYVILDLPVFGRLPSGNRLQQIKSLANYRGDALQNELPTPTLPPDVSYLKILQLMLKGNANGSPKNPLPHIIPNFTSSNELKIIWFGHSSYLIQVDGLNILVDPVFSEKVSPFQFIGSKRFLGTDFVHPEDFPNLDIVLITHDHYDHLDYDCILKLKNKTLKFITSLGVGAHLAHWGVEANKIIELSWQEQVEVNGLLFKALPARHFSGRKFKRNQTLWSSFLLQTKQHRLYLGGDSGYDYHFTRIGEEHGPFDLAILECGQYDEMWPLIHLAPEEVVVAAKALKAKKLLPVHWGKYKLALHNWDDPIKRLSRAAKDNQLEIATPKLGETFILERDKANQEWWLGL